MTALRQTSLARAAPGRRLAASARHGLLTASLMALFLVSPLTLRIWGFNYEAAGGVVFEKIHPAAWLAFAALALLVACLDAPSRFPDAVMRANPGLIVYALAFVILFQHIVLAQRLAFTPIIDTFLAPLALFLCLARLDTARRGWLAALLHAMMFANAMLGLYEFASGWRLTAFAPTAGGIEFETDWRSSAFLGHPLANALTTGVYALALAQGGGRALAPLLRPAALAIQLVAMAAFGGRASLVILAGLLALAALLGAGRLARGARVNLVQIALVAAAIPLAAIVMDQAIASGFFDRLIERFVDDKGSAKARIVLVQILNQFSWSELLIGPDPEKLASLQTLEGVEFGIESFWIGFILAYGAAASALFFIGLGFFCRELLRESAPGAWLALVFFFAVATTSVSISAKSLTLAQLVAIVLICLPRVGTARRA